MQCKSVEKSDLIAFFGRPAKKSGVRSAGAGWAPGQGTTCEILLPRVDEKPEHAARPPVSAATGEKTILVVEDHPEVLTLVTNLLRDSGHRVFSARSAQEGLELLDDHRDEVDLIVTDLSMPGMTGQKLAAQAKEIRPNVRVLIMSGFSYSSIEAAGLLTHGLHFIQKPFSSESLAEKVREVLLSDAEQAGLS